MFLPKISKTPLGCIKTGKIQGMETSSRGLTHSRSKPFYLHGLHSDLPLPLRKTEAHQDDADSLPESLWVYKAWPLLFIACSWRTDLANERVHPPYPPLSLSTSQCHTQHPLSEHGLLLSGPRYLSVLSLLPPTSSHPCLDSQIPNRDKRALEVQVKLVTQELVG